MTTLVYRDGILAADTQITYGSTIMPGEAKKIYRLPDGALYGFVGSLESGEIMRRWLADRNQPVPHVKTDNFEAIIISTEEGLLFFEDQDWIRMNLPFVAMGSGKDHAYGALQLGASAKQAVQAGMTLDPNSGGKVKTLELRGWKGKRSSITRCTNSIR